MEWIPPEHGMDSTSTWSGFHLNMEWIPPEHGKAISKTYTAITSAEGLLKPGNKESKRNALTNSPGDLFHVSKSALVR